MFVGVTDKQLIPLTVALREVQTSELWNISSTPGTYCIIFFWCYKSIKSAKITMNLLSDMHMVHRHTGINTHGLSKLIQAANKYSGQVVPAWKLVLGPTHGWCSRVGVMTHPSAYAPMDWFIKIWTTRTKTISVKTRNVLRIHSWRQWSLYGSYFFPNVQH